MPTSLILKLHQDNPNIPELALDRQTTAIFDCVKNNGACECRMLRAAPEQSISAIDKSGK
jgi:hypothetical protein